MVIEGKVAKVLNSRELIINKGTDDGVEIGMRFDVQGSGLDILDPDSHKKPRTSCPDRKSVCRLWRLSHFFRLPGRSRPTEARRHQRAYFP